MIHGSRIQSYAVSRPIEQFAKSLILRQNSTLSVTSYRVEEQDRVQLKSTSSAGNCMPLDGSLEGNEVGRLVGENVTTGEAEGLDDGFVVG